VVRVILDDLTGNLPGLEEFWPDPDAPKAEPEPAPKATEPAQMVLPWLKPRKRAKRRRK